MLLNHTSGIRSYTDMPGVMDGPQIKLDLTTAALIDSFKAEKPDFAPGEGWHYNNSGYVLLGAVIEAASGKPWHVYMDEGLLQAAGHEAHRATATSRTGVIPGHVDGYTRRTMTVGARRLSQHDPAACGRCAGVDRGRPAEVEPRVARRQGAARTPATAP